jgi:hypothetical protein
MVEPNTPFALSSDNHLYATTRNSLASNGSKIGQQLENACCQLSSQGVPLQRHQGKAREKGRAAWIPRKLAAT